MNENYNKQVGLNEVAKVANMPETSFSRFIKSAGVILSLTALPRSGLAMPAES